MKVEGITSLTGHQLKEKLLSRELTALGVVEELFAHIDDVEPIVRAYLLLDKEGAMRKAQELDARLKKGESSGALAGIPVAIKDNMCTIGLQNP